MRISDRWRRILLPICLSFVLLVTACSANEPSPYAQVQEETTGKGAEVAVDQSATNGSSFNRFFPKDVAGYNVTPTQEKRGFAEYKVSRDGDTVAMLSINDITSNPSAADKYRSSDLEVANYPAVDQGKTITGLLVNNRYQVKVLSRDPSFTRDERISWLQKFDLNGLAQLEARQGTQTQDQAQTPSVPSKARFKANRSKELPTMRVKPGLDLQPAT
ncbi:MAG: hypothetical protein ACFB4J_04755 [Elainellaceae cyanobacterium]